MEKEEKEVIKEVNDVISTYPQVCSSSSNNHVVENVVVVEVVVDSVVSIVAVD